MPSDRIIAIADDLTGALEIGAKFAGCGLRSVVTTELHGAGNLNVPVLVIDTETRHASAAKAAASVRAAAETARQRAGAIVYKKTDSTLRGNIAAELEALQAVFPERCIVYAPAYPELGRTVRDGKLLVHGVPVHQTEFANDRWSPVRDCRVEPLVRNVKAVIVEGECGADVGRAAEIVLAEEPPRICAGTAALAGALARKLRSHAVELRLPRVSRCLIVNGSLHSTSALQIETAMRNGVFDGAWRLFSEHVDGSGAERALRIGECVRRLLSATAIDALVVFGGETALGIHQALGSVPFEAAGEIAPGVAVSKTDDLLWITKAGGFGGADLLETLRKRLT